MSQVGGSSHSTKSCLKNCSANVAALAPSAPSGNPTTHTLFLLCLSSVSSALFYSDFYQFLQLGWLIALGMGGILYHRNPVLSYFEPIPDFVQVMPYQCVLSGQMVYAYITAALLAAITSRMGRVMASCEFSCS